MNTPTPSTDTVQSATVYDDVFIVAINEDGKERARAILKYFDCADLSDLLKEWHETDPTRRLGIKFRTGNPLQSELTRAREREKELVEALKQFADAAAKVDEFCEESRQLGMGDPGGSSSTGFGITFRHIRHARKTLSEVADVKS